MYMESFTIDQNLMNAISEINIMTKHKKISDESENNFSGTPKRLTM